MENQSVKILSVDAKDLYLSKKSGQTDPRGYSMFNAKGELRIGKFNSALDYSLELMELEKIFQEVYSEPEFHFTQDGKRYSRSVINVTFNYSVKKFNRLWNGVFIRYDIAQDAVELEDGIYILNGKLAAIQTGIEINHPVESEILENSFYYSEETRSYQAKEYIPTVFTVAELRRALYEDGFFCDGKKFVRYKRSAGSSRVGKCLFIDEKLYPKIHQWEMCGINVRETDAIDLAALESYISLPLSSIIGVLELRPENILVIRDRESRFSNRAVAVSLQGKHLAAEEREIEIQNNIFDGQSLIDPSAMGAFRRYGFLLLRNRMFKSACFNCEIQKWFADHQITSVKELDGYTRAEKLSDIKLITTPSSIKYLKFGSLEKWLDLLTPQFGIVKHEKPTPFFGGKLVQIHYQLINTLHMSGEEVARLISPSLDYLRLLKTDPAVLRFQAGSKGQGVRSDTPASTKNDIVYQLLGINEAFTKTKLYADFRTEILKSYTRNIRNGHILVNGNYSTLCGNPIEMLQAAIGAFDGSSQMGIGTIYSKRFPQGREILGCRSPHVTMGNIWIAKNRENPEIERYMNLTDTIVCVNSIGENLLSRLSGCDFDSDAVLLTDHPILLEAARKHYGDFGVPTSCVPAKKITRKYTPLEKAELDIQTSVNRIGEIVNLSQELNSLFWDRVNSGIPMNELSDLYNDIAILDVLSNIEIDKAKREYAIDSGGEISRIKQKYQVLDPHGKAIRPNFFGVLAKRKGYYDSQKKKYAFCKTSMDFLQHAVNKFRSPVVKEPLIPFSDILSRKDYHYSRVNYRQVNRVLEKIRAGKKDIQAVWKSENRDIDREAKALFTQEIQEELTRFVAELTMNSSTMLRLLAAMEEEKNRDICKMLFYTLFATANSSFYSLLQRSQEAIPSLIRDPDGEIELYGLRYRRSDGQN